MPVLDKSEALALRWSPRHQVQIQRQSATQDTLGEPQETWTTARTTWAMIETAQGQEAFGGAEFTQRVTHLITVRYSPQLVINNGMRIYFPNGPSSNTFKIQWIDNVSQANVWLQLHCLELNAAE